MTSGTELLTGEPRIARHVPLAIATIAAGALVVLFWALYFAGAGAGGGAATGQDEVAASFESAFPAADLLFACTLFATGVLLLRGREEAPFLLTIAAAQSLYLGILDFTFYFGQGFYARLTADSATELGINALCIGGGLAGVRAAWRLWGAPGRGGAR